jgi:hypothetical protein
MPTTSGDPQDSAQREVKTCKEMPNNHGNPLGSCLQLFSWVASRRKNSREKAISLLYRKQGEPLVKSARVFGQKTGMFSYSFPIS